MDEENNKNKLKQEHIEIIKEYKEIYDRLSYLDEQIKKMKEESDNLINRLEELRQREKNINNYG